MRVVMLALLLAACTPQLASAPQAISSASIAKPGAKLLDDVRVLSADDMEGRLAGSAGGAKARAYILKRLTEIGVQPAIGTSFEHRFPIRAGANEATGVNLLALVPGTAGSDGALVVMAHYDHVGIVDGQIYNGADDNASGVAALLAIAESLNQTAPLHDVILAIVDAEEGGMRGAKAMVADPGFQPLLDRTVLAVNFDMLSRSDRNELYAAGSYHFPWLKPRLEALAPAAQVNLKLGHDSPIPKDQDWTNQSDHAAFHAIGRPWVYFGVEDHPDYHKPTDDFGVIPQDFFRRSAATTELAVRAFDRDLEAIAAEAKGASD